MIINTRDFMATDEKSYRIEFDREGCIGAASCTAVSDQWIIVDDGKAELKGSLHDEKKEMWIKEINEGEFEKEMSAAKVCPVNAIHVISKKTGEKLI